MGALNNPRVIANCKILSQESKPGTCLSPMEASKLYIRRFLGGVIIIRDKVGGQTIAAILEKYCGWEREGRLVIKPGFEPPVIDRETARKAFAEVSEKIEAIRRINMRIKQQAKQQAKRKPVEI